ncbi:ribose-phosphate pyrophosphokinase [Candidatus Peregrinibacteria bacterium]|nr:MAG: ribose-phosphate pyrophosphokinase [Candidatus Peregrinibacteria bacterium]
MSQSKYKVFAGSSHPQLAQDVADLLDISLGKIKLSTFSCGEKYVVLEETVRGQEVFLIQTTTEGGVNDDYMELFLMINAAKMSFAKRVHVIIPHFGYSRQDKIHVPREPISAKLMADLLVSAGADHVVTLQLHSDQNQAFFDIPVDNLNAKKSLPNM